MQRRYIPPYDVQEGVLRFFSGVESSLRGRTAFVIACSKKKATHTAPAREMYRSGRFLTQLRISEAISEENFVLSAQHGILSMDTVIAPYDVTYPDGIFASEAQIPDIDKLASGRFDSIVFFGGVRYLMVLKKALKDSIPVIAPFEHLNSYRAALWCRLAEDYIERRLRASDIYAAITDVARTNGVHHFHTFPMLRNLPQRGVYFFFDPDEPTKFSSALPRIVRIGTHGVSKGSKSTLRTRLRAHFGQQDQSGNHRASIFRLHVGSAMLAKAAIEDGVATWGVGMSAPPEVRATERELEIAVSNYISRLLVTYVELLDSPAPASQRSVLEKAAINFFGADLLPLDLPSSNWLGLHSPMSKIQRTGLWNLQHNGERYNRDTPRLIVENLRSPMFSGA